MMDLFVYVSGVRGYEQAQRGLDATLAVKSDSGMQTELHPVESNVDKQYEWNEWELRRKALKLVRLTAAGKGRLGRRDAPANETLPATSRAFVVSPSPSLLPLSRPLLRD